MLTLEQPLTRPPARELATFKGRVKYYVKLAGKNQQALAAALDYRPNLLSAKLNNSYGAVLTNADAKIIINLIALWEGVSFKVEIQELLRLAGLRENLFEAESWYQRLG